MVNVASGCQQRLRMILIWRILMIATLAHVSKSHPSHERMRVEQEPADMAHALVVRILRPASISTDDHRIRHRALEVADLIEKGPRTARRSSSCLFNAGLGHNCDFKAAVGAVRESAYWDSASPGKRKRKIAPTLSTNVTA